jgi:hypothetical protein
MGARKLAAQAASREKSAMVRKLRKLEKNQGNDGNVTKLAAEEGLQKQQLSRSINALQRFLPRNVPTECSQSKFARDDGAWCLGLPRPLSHLHTPWLNHSTGESLTLSRELLLFADYVGLNCTEVNARVQMLRDIECVAKALWPDSMTHSFGSFPLGLSVFLSDVDMSILNVGLETTNSSNTVPEAPKHVPPIGEHLVPPPANHPSKLRGVGCASNEMYTCERCGSGLDTGCSCLSEADILAGNFGKQSRKRKAVGSSACSAIRIDLVSDSDSDSGSLSAGDQVQDKDLAMQRIKDIVESDSDGDGGSYNDGDADHKDIVENQGEETAECLGFSIDRSGSAVKSARGSENSSDDSADDSSNDGSASVQSLETDFLIPPALQSKEEEGHDDKQGDDRVSKHGQRSHQEEHQHFKRPGMAGLFAEERDKETSPPHSSPRRTATKGFKLNAIQVADRLKKLRKLYLTLQMMDWVETVQLRSKARVPIINLTHRCGVEIDVSLGISGEDTSHLVARFASQGLADSRGAFASVSSAAKLMGDATAISRGPEVIDASICHIDSSSSESDHDQPSEVAEAKELSEFVYRSREHEEHLCAHYDLPCMQNESISETNASKGNQKDARQSPGQLVRHLDAEGLVDRGTAFRTLACFLKVFLHQMALDKPFTGGVGSYKLYVMISLVLDSLETHARTHEGKRSGSQSDDESSEESLPRIDLGFALLSFLKFYGDRNNLNAQAEIALFDAHIDFRGNTSIATCQVLFKTAHDVLYNSIKQAKNPLVGKSRRNTTTQSLSASDSGVLNR